MDSHLRVLLAVPGDRGVSWGLSLSCPSFSQAAEGPLQGPTSFHVEPELGGVFIMRFSKNGKHKEH